MSVDGMEGSESEKDEEIPHLWNCGPLDDLEEFIAKLVNENVYWAYREVITYHEKMVPLFSSDALDKGDIALEIDFVEFKDDRLSLKVDLWTCISREIECYPDPEFKSKIVKALNGILDKLNAPNK